MILNPIKEQMVGTTHEHSFFFLFIIIFFIVVDFVIH